MVPLTQEKFCMIVWTAYLPRSLTWLLTLGLILGLLAGCGRSREAAATPAPVPAATTVPPTLAPPAAAAPTATGMPTHAAALTITAAPTSPALAPAPDDAAYIETLMGQMSVEEKLGQLFMVFFEGIEYSPALEKTIRDLHVGGILIFNGNAGPVEQVAATIAAAQATAATSGAQIPLFVGVDHEGGLIGRFGPLLTEFPGPMALAATGSVDNAAAVAAAMSRELLALGINMNLAPVLDVNSNPANPVIGARAFGETVEIVTTYGLPVIATFQEQGLIPTAKHFPGHGDTDVDSHTTLPVIDKTRAELDALELAPFVAAIDAGVDVIMTAHVAVPALTGDPALPATLSRAILTDLLRDDLGFDGLIAADSLGMNALDVAYGITNTVALAVDAGVDLLMFGADPGHTPVEQYWAFNHLLARVEAGQLTEARLDASVRRILQTKAKYGLLRPDPALTAAPTAAELAQVIRTSEHLALAARVSEEAMSLVKNDAGLIPLCPEESVALIYHEFEPELPGMLSRYAAQVTPILMTADPTPEERSRIISATATSDIVIVATVFADRYPGQAALVQALQGRPLVVMALTNPYDLLAFPEQATYLTTYSDNPPLLEAAAKLLYGEIGAAGPASRCAPANVP